MIVEVVGTLSVAVIAKLALIGKISVHDVRVAVCVFAITAAWDVVLNYVSQGKINVKYLNDAEWIKNIRGYFESMTTVEAAVVAGAVGVGVLPFIQLVNTTGSFEGTLKMMLWVFTVSALYGLPMRYIPFWFKELNDHYYYPNSFTTTLLLDGTSGVLVLFTYLAFQFMLGCFNWDGRRRG